MYHGGTMGETTRRMAAIIQGGGGGDGGGKVSGVYVGGFAGSNAGTWGKAGRGLMDKPKVPTAADAGSPLFAGGALRPQGDLLGQRPASARPGVRPSPFAVDSASPVDYGAGPTSPGKRERIRPNSAGVKSNWDVYQQEAEAKRQQQAATMMRSTRAPRPKTATMARTTRPMTGLTAVAPVEYRLTGQSLVADRPVATQPGGGGGGAGARGRDTFDSYAPKQQPAADPYTMQAAMPQQRSTPPAAGGAGGSAAPASPSNALMSSSVEGLSEARLARLEDEIRDALRTRRSAYEGNKDMLLRLFRAVDNDSGDVDPGEFIGVCDAVGVAVTPAEAQALFKRHGYEGGIMPYEKFAHTLLTQPSRLLATEMPSRKGAFTSGHPMKFVGKVLYPQCRTAVYTPSDWDPEATIARSSELPDMRLMLEFAYGYNGDKVTTQNLYYNVDGRLVWHVAGLAVVHDKAKHAQHFFLQHNDDITSLAVCPVQVEHDGCSYPARSLVATGQISDVKTGPYICVWDSRAPPPSGDGSDRQLLAKIQFPKEARGITALGFSPDGQRLAAVATDNKHMVYVIDWRRGRIQSEQAGQNGEPPQVYGVEWNPFCPPGAAEFVTFGHKHVKVWREGADKRWASTTLSPSALLPKGRPQNVHSACFVRPRAGSSDSVLVIGLEEGGLVTFSGTTAKRLVEAHGKGPKTLQAGGHIAYNGVCGMRLAKDGNVLLTGGADGVIIQWDVSDGGGVKTGKLAGAAISLRDPYSGSKPPQIKSLDWSASSGRILVGTASCDVLEVSETTHESVLDSHSAQVMAVATHPTNPNIAATISLGREGMGDSNCRICMWDLEKRTMSATAALPFAPATAAGMPSCALAFSSKPIGGVHHIAVGGNRSELYVLSASDLRPLAMSSGDLKPRQPLKPASQGTSAISYSPDGRLMAACQNDQFVDIYAIDPRGSYSHVRRCQGHSSNVKFCDWSADSSVLKTVSADYEVLYWDARAGKQVTSNQRDTTLATYTCPQGFEVMGIWPPYTDGTDINAVDRSRTRPPGQELIVTADDGGFVKLFNFPCVVTDAPHRAYIGHSSHVMGVSFTCDDDKVISAGGEDWAVLQFRVVPAVKEQPATPRVEPQWGALDPQGRQYGYTTHPFTVGGAAASPAASPAAVAGAAAATRAAAQPSASAPSPQPQSTPASAAASPSAAAANRGVSSTLASPPAASPAAAAPVAVASPSPPSRQHPASSSPQPTPPTAAAHSGHDAQAFEDSFGDSQHSISLGEVPEAAHSIRQVQDTAQRYQTQVNDDIDDDEPFNEDDYDDMVVAGHH